MSDSKPVTVLVTYRFKEGAEEPMRRLLEKHWPTLDRLGLVTPEPPKVWRAQGKDGRPYFVEMFEWKDAGASDVDPDRSASAVTSRDTPRGT